MSTINDGGPAFPHEAIIEVVQAPAGVAGVTGGGRLRRAGMTLRDWFAGQVLAGKPNFGQGCTEDDAAAYCYLMADAMLAERAKEKKS